MKKIGNYLKTGNINADMLICIWSFKSAYRLNEWQYAGYDEDSYNRAQENLKALGLINKRGALKSTTKQVLSNAGWGSHKAEAALKMVIKSL